VCCDPTSVPYVNGCRNEWKCWILIVVGGSTEVGVLAHDSVGADGNSVHTVTVDVVPQNAVLPHFELSWQPDSYSGVRARSWSDPGAEESQHPPPPSVERSRTRAIKKRPHDSPHHPLDLISWGMTAPEVCKVNRRDRLL